MLLFIVILCVWRILWFLIQNWCLYVLCLLPDSYFGLGSQSREKKKCITYQLEYIWSIYFYVVFVFGNDVYQFYWLLIFYCYRAMIKVMYNIKFFFLFPNIMPWTWGIHVSPQIYNQMEMGLWYDWNNFYDFK
jgi:hypothetical protein